MFCAVTILCWSSLYFLAHRFLGRVGPWTIWMIFGILPAILSPYWLACREFDAFIWIKLYSVLFCVCWGTWFRFSNRNQSAWARRSIHWLLIANIAEATILDFAAGWNEHVHWLNAFAGSLLIAELLCRRLTVNVDTKSHCPELHFEVSLPWIIGYSLWNWTFVYLNYPSFAGTHMAVLLAALVVGLIDKRRWVQARAATLATNLLIMAVSPDFLMNS